MLSHAPAPRGRRNLPFRRPLPQPVDCRIVTLGKRATGFLVTPALFSESSDSTGLVIGPERDLEPCFALEDGCSNTTTSQLGEERQRINRFRQACRSEPLQGSVDNESTGDGRHCASGNRGPVHCSVDEHRSASVNASTDFDTHRARTAFRVGRPQHGESSGQTIASRRRNTRRHPTDFRKSGDEKERIG